MWWAAWPAILVCGGSFAGIQFVTANFHGPTLVDVVGGLGSLVVAGGFPAGSGNRREVWRFPDEPPVETQAVPPAADARAGGVRLGALGAACQCWCSCGEPRR